MNFRSMRNIILWLSFIPVAMMPPSLNQNEPKPKTPIRALLTDYSNQREHYDWMLRTCVSTVLPSEHKNVLEHPRMQYCLNMQSKHEGFLQEQFNPVQIHKNYAGIKDEELGMFEKRYASDVANRKQRMEKTVLLMQQSVKQ